MKIPVGNHIFFDHAEIFVMRNEDGKTSKLWKEKLVYRYRKHAQQICWESLERRLARSIFSRLKRLAIGREDVDYLIDRKIKWFHQLTFYFL